MAVTGPNENASVNPLQPSEEKKQVVKGEKLIRGHESPKRLPVSKAVTDTLAHVKRVPYISLEVLKEKLRPGDIFLSYYPKSSDAVAGAIRAGQMLGKAIKEASTLESHNFVHAALYLGDGELSEAISDGVRISALDGDRFKLKAGKDSCFLVVRPKNEVMAKEACEIARELSAKSAGEQTTYKYSVAKALLSGFSEGKLEKDSLVRYLKGAAYAHNKIQPMSKSGIREFFCSYFVGWACQAGESKEVLAKINKSLPEKEKITFPNLHHVPKSEQGKVLSEWANRVVSEHEGAFRNAITLHFDPKYTSPQAMYLFFLKHPELFTQEMLIVAAPNEMEMM